MSGIKKIAVNTLGFMLIAALVQGFQIRSWGIALLASLVLGFLNLLVKPLLQLLTWPINFLTFGLFSFILNAMILSMTAAVVGDGFYLKNFWTTLLVSLLLALFQRFVQNLIRE